MMKAGIIKRYRFELTLAAAVLITFLFGLFPPWVEHWYSNGIYPYIARAMRFLLGWIPFSIGDIFYGLFALYLLYKLVHFISKWRRKELNVFARKRMARKSARTIMIIYLAFQWLWGLNYHRLGSAYQLKIEPVKYSKEELIQLTDTLQSKLQVLIAAMQPSDSLVWKDFDTVCKACIHTYGKASKDYHMLKYRSTSIKLMLVPAIGGYGGFSGYLNPFTAEAQANDQLPSYLQPYTLCHEIAHQLGYAAEEEANLAGYLACRSSNNPAMRYSVYHDLLMYAGRELYYQDTVAYHHLYDSLPYLVKQHNLQAKAYFAQFKNPVQVILNKWYDLYLKINNQEKGVRSYTYVTAWLIAYARKYGWDSL